MPHHEGDDEGGLVDWLAMNGVSVDAFPLSLHHFGGAGRGFVASRNIKVCAQPNEHSIKMNQIDRLSK